MTDKTQTRQQRHRDRIKEKLARLERYEGALREIMNGPYGSTEVGYIAFAALNPTQPQ